MELRTLETCLFARVFVLGEHHFFEHPGEVFGLTTKGLRCVRPLYSRIRRNIGFATWTGQVFNILLGLCGFPRKIDVFNGAVSSIVVVFVSKTVIAKYRIE